MHVKKSNPSLGQIFLPHIKFLHIFLFTAHSCFRQTDPYPASNIHPKSLCLMLMSYVLCTYAYVLCFMSYAKSSKSYACLYPVWPYPRYFCKLTPSCHLHLYAQDAQSSMPYHISHTLNTQSKILIDSRFLMLQINFYFKLIFPH